MSETAQRPQPTRRTLGVGAEHVRTMVAGRAALEGIALELLTAQFPGVKGIRLLGISISVL